VGIAKTPSWNLIGQMSSKNWRKICRAQVVSTMKGGKVWSMD
jgi:hypothetical protein